VRANTGYRRRETGIRNPVFRIRSSRFERLSVQQRESERHAGHLFETLLHRAFVREL